jgi:CubicO group peptidase (beta-lactamase class C family)
VQDNDGQTSNAATVTVTVVANQPPTAVDDSVSTDENSPVTVNVIANDTDADGTIDPATVSIITDPVDGSVLDNGDGTVTYTPDSGFTGIDTFTYTVQDNDGQTSNVATVTVTVDFKYGIYYPPSGEGLDRQNQRIPEEVGLGPGIIDELQDSATRWSLWRHGYLVHIEGNFNTVIDVASLRKTWHALTVGAAIKQEKIPSYNQKISVWQTELTGNDANATWWHVITQSSAFDYPYDVFPDYEPGEMWTYSDYNPFNLNHALAKVYGKQDFYDNYDDVLEEAYFNTIGMQGWSTRIVYDPPSQMADGIRLELDLEDMGRLGLLVMSRGKWDGIEVIPQWFVEELESKQTYGMLVNYNGPNDGIINLDPAEFPESPYGYMTWVNTDEDYYPGADKHWAFGQGYGGNYVLWNSLNGIVYAGVGVQTDPTSDGIPHIIDRNIEGPNPLAPDLFFCKADFNDDSKVDDADLDLFSFAIGEIDCTWSPDLCDVDTDGDHDVDGADFAVLAAEFGKVGCL